MKQSELVLEVALEREGRAGQTTTLASIREMFQTNTVLSVIILGVSHCYRVTTILILFYGEFHVNVSDNYISPCL